MENKKLNDLYDAVADELLAKIQSGEAKPADLAVAVRFLKDNDMKKAVDVANRGAAITVQHPGTYKLTQNDLESLF